MTERRCTQCNRQITAAPEETAQPETRREICRLRDEGELFTADDLRECLTRYYLEGVRVGRAYPIPYPVHGATRDWRSWGGRCTPDRAPDWPPTEWDATDYARRVREHVAGERRGRLDEPLPPRDWRCDHCGATREELLQGNSLLVRQDRATILCEHCLQVELQWENEVTAEYYEHVDPDVRAARGGSPPLT